MAHFYPSDDSFEKKNKEMYDYFNSSGYEDYYLYYEPIQFLKKDLVFILREGHGIFILRIVDEIDTTLYKKELEELNNKEIEELNKKKSEEKQKECDGIINRFENRLSVDRDYFLTDICPNMGKILRTIDDKTRYIHVGYWTRNPIPKMPYFKTVKTWFKDAKFINVLDYISAVLKKETDTEIIKLAKNAIFPDFDSTSKIIRLENEQKKYVYFGYNENKRVEGAAGTGKTIIGVKRAIERAKEGDYVLYLYYNITLKKYIESLIKSQIPRDCDSFSIFSRIKVTHYHDIVKSYHKKAISNEFEPKSYNDEPYLNYSIFNSVIVDEAQDFKSEYFDMLRALFKNARSFLFLADFNQNIYNRSWDNEDEKTNDNCEEKKATAKTKPVLSNFGFRGPWPKLKTNFRSDYLINKYISMVCSEYNILGPQVDDVPLLMDDNSYGNNDGNKNYPHFIYHDTKLNLYKNLNDNETGEHGRSNIIDEETMKYVCDKIKDYIKYVCDKIKDDIKGDDKIKDVKKFVNKNTVILSSQRDTLRSLQKIYPDKYESMVATNINPNDVMKDSYDRLYKLTFNNNSNSIKFSTIYSYKGYEADNVIILLDTRIVVNDLADKQIQEKEWLEGRKKELALIYTAISRSRKNVVLIGFNDSCSDDIKKYFRDNFNYQCTDEYNNTMDFDIPF